MTSVSMIADRYRVVRLLGEGASSRIFLAVDQSSRDAEVAVKLLGPRHSVEQRSRFKREFAALSRASHPHLVRAFDFGASGSDLYYTSEVIRGDDLEAFLKRKENARPEAVVEILAQVASALEHLRRRDLAHGDLRPSNILCARTNRGISVKLIDLGLTSTGAAVSQDLRCFGRIITHLAEDVVRRDGRLSDIVKRMTMNSVGRLEDPAAVIEALRRLDPTIADEAGRDLRLFGRDAELQALKGMLEAAEAGRPHLRVAMIHGEAGSGRSALLEQVRIEAQLMGFVVGFPHVDAEDRGPYQVARSAIGMLVSAGFPVLILGRRYPDPVELKFAVTRALTVIAERTPVALLFDDLDQADPDSRALVEHIASVMALRNDCRIALAISGRRKLVPADRSIEIKLAPLAREAMSQLAGAFSGTAADGSLVDGLMDASTGNAGLARELLEASRDRLQVAKGALRLKEGESLSLPKLRLEDAARRMGGLSPELREAAELLALARRPVMLKYFPSTGKNVDFRKALEGLIDAGLADSSAHAFRPASPPLRRAIVEQIPAARKRELHRRLAMALEVPGRQVEFDRLEMLAHHWIESGDVAKAEHWGLELAEKLAYQTAFQDAAETYGRIGDLRGPSQAKAWEGARVAARHAGRFERMVEMAKRRLEVEPTPEAGLALGGSLQLRGDLPAALVAFQAVIDDPASKPETTASAHLGRAGVYHIMRRSEEQKKEIEAARKTGAAPKLAMKVEEGQLALIENRFPDAVARYTEGLSQCGADDTLVRLDLLRGLANAQLRLARPREAIKTYLKAEKTAFARMWRVAAAHYDGLRAYVLEVTGHHLKARRAMGFSLNVAIEAGRRVCVSNHSYNLANLEMLHGDTAAAEKHVAMCMEAAGETNEKHVGTAALSVQAVLHAQRSNFRLAGANLETALRQASPTIENALIRNHAVTLWMGGAWTPGVAVFKKSIKKFIELRAPIDAIPVVIALYEARLKLNDGSAEPYLSQIENDVAPWKNRFARSGILLARAMDDLRRGNKAAARDKANEALALFQRNVGLDFVLLAKLVGARAGGARDPKVDLVMDAYHEALQRGRLRYAEEAAELIGDRHVESGNPHAGARWHHEALRIFRERKQDWFEDPACGADLELRGRELAAKPTASPEVAAQRDAQRLLAELERDMSSYELLDPILMKCMKSLLQLTGGERAMILLEDKKKLYIRVRANLPRLEETPEIRFCRTVVNKVWRDQRMFHTANAAEDFRLLNAPSARELNIQSIICLPLSARGKSMGVIYIDNRSRSGVFESIPLDQIETIRERVALLIHQSRLEEMYHALKSEVEQLRTVVRNRDLAENPKAVRMNRTERPRQGPFAAFIGESPAIAKVLQLIESAAATESTVLILGETGTGKELAARALHEAGSRSRKPFVAINCAAIPEPTLESEIFGHVKGAFTGADRDKKGLFQAADGGTLFLDEIAEMSLGIQAALLRALETGEVRAVGAVQTEKVDVRVIAASNRDLLTMSKAEKFRSDLLYRLKVVQVIMPPLRDRKEDLPFFIEEFEKGRNRKLELTPDVLKEFFDYGWPGNVRELKNVIDSLHVLPADKVSLYDVRRQLGIEGLTTPSNSIWDNIALAEKTTLLNVLRTEKSLSAAARRLGLVRSQMYRLIHRYELTEFMTRKVSRKGPK